MIEAGRAPKRGSACTAWTAARPSRGACRSSPTRPGARWRWSGWCPPPAPRRGCGIGRPTPGEGQAPTQGLQALGGDGGVDPDAVGLHDIGQSVGIDQLVDGGAGIEEEDRTPVDVDLGVRGGRRGASEVDHGDPPHGQPTELSEHGVHHGDLLAQTVDHPVPGPVELDGHRSHLGGDGVGVEGAPELLGAVVEHLGAVDLGLEPRLPQEDGDHLAVADAAHVRDEPLSRSGVHGRCPSGDDGRGSSIATDKTWTVGKRDRARLARSGDSTLVRPVGVVEPRRPGVGRVRDPPGSDPTMAGTERAGVDSPQGGRLLRKRSLSPTPLRGPWPTARSCRGGISTSSASRAWSYCRTRARSGSSLANR